MKQNVCHVHKNEPLLITFYIYTCIKLFFVYFVNKGEPGTMASQVQWPLTNNFLICTSGQMSSRGCEECCE